MSNIHLIFHGAVILFLANLMGFPLGRAMASKHSMPEKKDAWRMAHSATSGFGVFLLATAGCIPYLILTLEQKNTLIVALILSGYGFFVGSLLAALSGQRGLRMKMPIANLSAHLCYLVGILGSMIGVPLIVYGAWNAF